MYRKENIEMRRRKLKKVIKDYLVICERTAKLHNSDIPIAFWLAINNTTPLPEKRIEKERKLDTNNEEMRIRIKKHLTTTKK